MQPDTDALPIDRPGFLSGLWWAFVWLFSSGPTRTPGELWLVGEVARLSREQVETKAALTRVTEDCRTFEELNKLQRLEVEKLLLVCERDRQRVAAETAHAAAQQGFWSTPRPQATMM